MQSELRANEIVCLHRRYPRRSLPPQTRKQWWHLARSLSGDFAWADTVEGFEFWNGIFEVCRVNSGYSSWA